MFWVFIQGQIRLRKDEKSTTGLISRGYRALKGQGPKQGQKQKEEKWCEGGDEWLEIKTKKAPTY